MNTNVPNTAIKVTIDGETSNLVTDADGKVQVSGCEAGTLQARSTHIVGLSGTINVEGYCEETFTALKGTSGSEIVVNLTQSKGNQNMNFSPQQNYTFPSFFKLYSDCEDWYSQPCCDL